MYRPQRDEMPAEDFFRQSPVPAHPISDQTVRAFEALDPADPHAQLPDVDLTNPPWD
jgi:hypothetical protein